MVGRLVKAAVSERLEDMGEVSKRDAISRRWAQAEIGFPWLVALMVVLTAVVAGGASLGGGGGLAIIVAALVAMIALLVLWSGATI